MNKGRGKYILLAVVILQMSCLSYDKAKKHQLEFKEYASDSASISIQSIGIWGADKRFYRKMEHTEMEVDFNLLFINLSPDTIALREEDFYAIYRHDTVGWGTIGRGNEEILPE